MFSIVLRSARAAAIAAGLFLLPGAVSEDSETPVIDPTDGLREFVFGTGLVMVEADRVIVRVPAEEGTLIKLWIGDQEFEGEMGPEAKVFITVDAPGGEPGEFPFDEERDQDYDPYIEFVFIGGSEMEKIEVDGVPKLLVRSSGRINLDDEADAMPFSLGQLIEAGRLEVTTDDDVWDPGPHWPKRDG